MWFYYSEGKHILIPTDRVVDMLKGELKINECQNQEHQEKGKQNDTNCWTPQVIVFCFVVKVKDQLHFSEGLIEEEEWCTGVPLILFIPI